jgi:hypothetical protein
LGFFSRFTCTSIGTPGFTDLFDVKIHEAIVHFFANEVSGKLFAYFFSYLFGLVLSLKKETLKPGSKSHIGSS